MAQENKRHTVMDGTSRVATCSQEALYCSCVFVFLCQIALRVQVWAPDMREAGPCPVRGAKEDRGKESCGKRHSCRHRAPVLKKKESG